MLQIQIQEIMLFYLMEKCFYFLYLRDVVISAFQKSLITLGVLIRMIQVRITNDDEGWELISDLDVMMNSPGAMKALDNME